MGDGDRKFVVQNGTLLVGQGDFGVHVSATYCDAFAAKTGERPLWLEPDSCFQSVGSDTLLFQGQDGSWVMKGRDGSVRWTHEGDEQEFQAVGDELYLSRALPTWPGSDLVPAGTGERTRAAGSGPGRRRWPHPGARSSTSRR